MEFRKLPFYHLDNQPVCLPNSNAGLLFDKFFDAYDTALSPLEKNEYEEDINYKNLFLHEFLFRYSSGKLPTKAFWDYTLYLDDVRSRYKREIDAVRRKLQYEEETEDLREKLGDLEHFSSINQNKINLINQYNNVYIKNPSVIKKQLSDHKERHLNLVNKLHGIGRNYELTGHFVTGMGNSHPVENGFLWHYTLGVPYLSGNQVKGLVRALIEQYYPEKNDKDKENKKATLLKWFGSESKDSKDTQIGELIFFDAIPIELPELSVDIMTPHMGDWYSDGSNISNLSEDSKKIPADWHDPNPIPFLAVKNATFLFTIAKRPDSDINIDKVFEYLEQALEFVGAGAKTQTGYGFMISDEPVDSTSKSERLSKNKENIVNLHNRLEAIQKKLKSSEPKRGGYDELFNEIINTYQSAKDWDNKDDCKFLLEKISLELINQKIEFVGKGKKSLEELKKSIEKLITINTKECN